MFRENQSNHAGRGGSAFTRPVSENGKVNILTRLAYGGGDVACNVVYGMIATLLTLFYTDYAGVSVATVGLGQR